MSEHRKSTICSSDYITKIELALAKALGVAKYKLDVKRTPQKGVYDFGGEEVTLQLAEDDKTLNVSKDGTNFKVINKFIEEQRARYEKNGGPPRVIPTTHSKDEDESLGVSWYELKKAEEDLLEVKGNCCVGGRVIRSGTIIIPLESSFWDTFLGLGLVVAKASVAGVVHNS